MKHFSALLLAFLLGLSINAQAVTYCSNSAFGYGRNATGGGNATPVLVSSVSQLQSALNKGKNKVIIITASLTFTSMLTVQDGANVTLMALPGVTLTSTQQNSTNSGILFIKRFDNIIIRNLTFVGPGAYDCDGNDLLCFEKVTNAWVDHCDFQDGCDGNFDNKSLTDNVTISWCRFRYLKAPKAGGSGGSDDHRFTNLLGSSSSDKPDDGTYNFTWAYCWWDDGCKERMVRCRNAELHFLNCYWNSSVANYYVGPENAKAYFEGCTFAGAANSSSKIWKSYGGTNACKFVNCSGNLPSNSGSVSAPSYSYDQLAPATAKTMVTNSTCGAGATLTVTTSGAVSSSCDGGGGGQAAPTLTLTSGQANQTVNLGNPISNIVYTASGTANAISVANLPNGLTSSKNGLVLTISGSPTATGTYTVTATNSSGVTASLQGTITVNDGSGGSTGGGGSNNYIYYWQMSGTTAYANNSSHDALPSGCTLYAGTTDDSKTYSVESATYVDGVPSSMQAANGKGTKMVANAQYFKATLASGNFQAGDTIFVCGYNDWKISTTSSQTGDVIAALGTGSDKNSYQVGYTILSANTSELYFMRANGAGTGITAIKVCRPSSAPPAAPTLTLTSGQASQTVNSGSAISNIVYTASGTATSITVSGLPAGLTFSKNGLVLTISGTPTATGTYTVTAANSAGVTTTLQGTITVNSGGGGDPTPSGEITWNFSKSEFNSLDSIKANVTINGLTITATAAKPVVIATGSKTIDDITFTHVLKTGGSGASTYRSLSFAVTGACTIEVYLISAKSTEERTLNVYSGSYGGTLLTTMPAGTTASKQTYSYTGGATTIYMGSDNSGINIYGINLIYPGGNPQPTTYTLTYDENGGSGTMNEQTGTNVTVVANGFTAPTGYSFQEWNTNSRGTGDTYAAGDNITLTEDMTLYAIWQPNTYTVTLNAGSGIGGTASVNVTFDGAMPNILVPTRDGYNFLGYFTEANGAGTQYYDANGSGTNNWIIAANTTLYAAWEEASVTPIVDGDLHFWFFYADDATANGLSNDNTVFSSMVASGSQMAGSITIDGHSYSVTRRTGDNQVFGSFTIPTGKEAIFYALAVSSGGGDRQINLVNGNTTIELPVAGGSDSYKRLESETLSAGTYSIEREGSNNVRLSVVVVKIIDAGTTPQPTTYTVTWNANGGTCATATSTVEENTAVGTLPEASRDGYTFDGWFTQATGGTQVTSSTVITADITFYAHWTENQGGGGEGCDEWGYGTTVTTVPSAGNSVTSGDLVVKNIGSDVYSGPVFNNSGTTSAVKANSSGKYVTGTLGGQLIESITFSVSCSTNDDETKTAYVIVFSSAAEFSTSNIIKVDNANGYLRNAPLYSANRETVTLSAPSGTKSFALGRNISGANIDGAGSSGSRYFYYIQACPVENVVPNSYTVTFKDKDGNTLKTETVEEGGSATAPAIPAVDCYTGAWDKTFDNVTSDLVVTATYTVDKHSVTIHYEATQGSVTIQ